MAKKKTFTAEHKALFNKLVERASDRFSKAEVKSRKEITETGCAGELIHHITFSTTKRRKEASFKGSLSYSLVYGAYFTFILHSNGHLEFQYCRNCQRRDQGSSEIVAENSSFFRQQNIDRFTADVYHKFVKYLSVSRADEFEVL